MQAVGKLLVLFGVVLLVLGLLLQLAPSLPWLGRLPGDIRIERGGFRLYFPLATCLLLSAALSALFWLFSRLR